MPGEELCTVQGCTDARLVHMANDHGRCYNHFIAIDCNAV